MRNKVTDLKKALKIKEKYHFRNEDQSQRITNVNKHSKRVPKEKQKGWNFWKSEENEEGREKKHREFWFGTMHMFERWWWQWHNTVNAFNSTKLYT